MDWYIKCPHCNHKHKNWQDYIDTGDMEGEFPMDCEKCKQEFEVSYSTEITFKTSPDYDKELDEEPVEE